MLVFLGIDALVEGNKIAAENVAGVFNGQMLIAMVTIVSFLALLYVSGKLVERANTVKKNKEISLRPSYNLIVNINVIFYIHMKRTDNNKQFSNPLHNSIDDINRYWIAQPR